MSKYDALADHLAQQPSREHPMTFREVEQVIGSKLPDSAREHRPWWANNAQSHVPKRGWMRAGFRTARVDMAGERVVFVRGEPGPGGGSALKPETRSSGEIRMLLAALPLAVRALIERTAEKHGGDPAAAVVELLHKAVVAERSEMLAGFVGQSARGSDSVDLVREDRDGR